MPEEEIELSNSKIQDMAKSIVPPHLPQIINKNKNSQPAKKNYAALILGINKTPNDLLGLVPEQLIEMLGPPGFRRADAPAEIWQYRYGGCVLNVILYETGKNKPLQVAHYTTRSTVKGAIPERSCLFRLLIERKKSLDRISG
jgi:hypothetical protein